MEFYKTKTLKHSGLGNPIHKKLMDEFRKSEKLGIKFCNENNFKFEITNILLKVWQEAEYGFSFSALIKR